MRRLLIFGVVAAVACGCTTTSTKHQGSISQQITSSPAPDSTAAGAGSVTMPRAIFCAGDPVGPQVWTRQPDDLVVGPLTWPHMRSWATASPTGYGYQDTSGFHYKIGALLRAGSTVNVTVAPEARGEAGLEYGLRWDYSPAQSVTFHACPTADTGFVGGFFVKKNRCLPLDVRVGNAPPVRVVVSVFAGPCPI